ncbi:MAG: tyrosine-type recombinase/integrase [Colwellia sp.]
MKLTDSILKKHYNKTHDKPFELSDRDSISVRVSAKGKISWQFRFRYNQKAERLTLGHYPYLTLSAVRKLAPELQGLLFEGKNPKTVWNNKKNNNKGVEIITLSSLVQNWFESTATGQFKDTTYNNYESTINKWVYNSPKDNSSLSILWVKKYLSMPFDEIRNAQWMDYFDWICKEGSPTTAGSVLKILKTVVKWGLKRERISNGNLLLFKVNDVGETPKVGERTPSPDEIALLWLEIERSKALPQTKICLQLIILFGGRNTAIRTAKWSDFDFENNIWTIPNPKRLKENKRTGTLEDDNALQRPERHPIPGKALELLDKLAQIYGREGYVFPGERTSGAISIHAIDRFCGRMSAKLFIEYGISKIKPHDFRRSIASILCEIDPKWLPVIDKILGHKIKGTNVHYNKADYIEQQHDAYDLYWSILNKSIERATKN